MNPMDLHQPALERQESLLGMTLFCDFHHGTGSLPPFARADSTDGLKSFAPKEVPALPDGLLTDDPEEEDDEDADGLFATGGALFEPIPDSAGVHDPALLMSLPQEEEHVGAVSVRPVSRESTRASVVSPDPSTSHPEGHKQQAGRFRSYQADHWSKMFGLLCDYKKTHGDCKVPYKYPANPALARWVKRQRYQYTRRAEGRKSTLTTHRLAALEWLGFCWDVQTAGWSDRFAELQRFHWEHGHCRVPARYPENPALAVWVKAQRRQYKLGLQGRPNALTQHRREELDRIGFAWMGKNERRNSSVCFPPERRNGEAQDADTHASLL